jgi:hypothetical protein
VLSYFLCQELLLKTVKSWVWTEDRFLELADCIMIIMIDSNENALKCCWHKWLSKSSIPSVHWALQFLKLYGHWFQMKTVMTICYWELFCLFVQKSYSKTYGYQQTLPEMSEAESLSSLMRGHDPMMAVLTSRQRNLKITYSLWHNKEMKVTVGTLQQICISN